LAAALILFTATFLNELFPFPLASFIILFAGWLIRDVFIVYCGILLMEKIFIQGTQQNPSKDNITVRETCSEVHELVKWWRRAF
jgi:hypothetical protein